MSININSNFLLNTQLPLDARSVVLDATARDAIITIQRYEGLAVYLTSTSQTFQLQGGITNGDWVEITGGGVVTNANSGLSLSGTTAILGGTNILDNTEIGVPLGYSLAVVDAVGISTFNYLLLEQDQSELGTESSLLQVLGSATDSIANELRFFNRTSPTDNFLNFKNGRLGINLSAPSDTSFATIQSQISSDSISISYNEAHGPPGLVNATFSNSYTGSVNETFAVDVDGTGTPNTFHWIQIRNGTTINEQSNIPITGSAQLLSDGMSITFASTTGNVFGANKQTNVNLFYDSLYEGWNPLQNDQPMALITGAGALYLANSQLSSLVKIDPTSFNLFIGQLSANNVVQYLVENPFTGSDAGAGSSFVSDGGLLTLFTGSSANTNFPSASLIQASGGTGGLYISADSGPIMFGNGSALGSGEFARFDNTTGFFGIGNSAPGVLLDVGTGTKGAGAVADADIRRIQAVYVDNTGASFSNSAFYTEQTVASVGAFVGIDSVVSTSNSTGSVDQGIALNGTFILNGVGTVAKAVSINAALDTTVAGTITNFYAFKADPISNTASATITNAFGYFVGNFPSGVTNKYSFYSGDTTGINVFFGTTGIGLSNPQNVLQVANNGSLATGYTGIRVGITSGTTTLGSASKFLTVDSNGDIGLYTVSGSGFITTADNGLSVSGTTVELGGSSLNQNTTITRASHFLQVLGLGGVNSLYLTNTDIQLGYNDTVDSGVFEMTSAGQTFQQNSIPAYSFAPGSFTFDNTSGATLATLTDTNFDLISTTTATPRGFIADQINSGTQGARITMRKARGTVGSLSTIVTGDVLGSWTASGYDGASYIDSAKILVTSTGTIGTGIIPSTMALQTMTSGGALTTAVTLGSDQTVTLSSIPAFGSAATLFLVSNGGVVSSRTASQVRSDIGAGTGSGTVTNFVFTNGNGFTGTVSTSTTIPTLSLTTSLTLGSVPVIGASGALTEDNANFFYNTTSHFLGIGTATPAARLNLSSNISATAWTTNGINLRTDAATYTDTSTAGSGTVTNSGINAFGIPTIASTNLTVTYTNAATLYIAGAPVAGTNVSITNPYAINVAGGNVLFGAQLIVQGVLRTSTTLANSNFVSAGVSSGSGAASTTNSQFLFQSATTVMYKNFMYGSTSTVLGANNSYGSVIFGASPITAAVSGTSALLANVVIRPLAITTGVGGITNTATLYLDGAATGGTNNYSLWSAGGGNIRLDLGSDATGDIFYRASTGVFTRLAIGTSTQVLHGGTIPSYSAVSLTTDVTGILPILNGGTGSSTYGPRAGADLTGQTSTGTITSYAVTGGNGTFRVGGYVNITAVSVDAIKMQVQYTDENSNVVQTDFFAPGTTSVNLTVTGNFVFPDIQIRAKTGTTIFVTTVLVIGGGSITYDVGGTIEQLR